MSLEGARPAGATNGIDMHAYVVSHIDDAIEQGWVRPYFQPVVRTLTGKLCGSEALARWDDPTYGLLAPDQFIGPLEEAQLIHKLDCDIVRQVCRLYRTSIDASEAVVPVSFNLSRLDFDLCDIFHIIEDAVYRYEVPRNMVNIEITESSLAVDPSYMASMIRKFHDVGYQVWMDDFGSGYSTLNVLKDFDFDALKIDMEFLNRFGEKSKTILASVVDMAKKLGIQTVAEGVETEEHRRYLRRIGCEKMQGYLFGRPHAHTSETARELDDDYGIETQAERYYLTEIGGVNTLSLSERDLTAGSSTDGYVTSMPLAIVEYANDRFTILDSNRVFREGLENVGIASVEDAQRLVNDQRRTFARKARHTMDIIERDKFARFDYVTGDVACLMRVKHITSRNGKIAVLVSIDDTIEQNKRKRYDRMTEILGVLYSIYEHVDVIHLGDGYIEPVFDSAGYHVPHQMTLEAVAACFAEDEVFPADRSRYLAFVEPSSMLERIRQGGENFIAEFFRVRQHGGNYVWKMLGLIRIDGADIADDQVLMCIRSTHWAHDGLLQAVYEEGEDNLRNHVAAADFTLTEASLWRAVAADTKMGLFWKDRDRRFVGVNQAFLDYYGFKSDAEVLGKTDEDMRWHIDPVPFMQSELRVLNEGAHVESALGQCIAKGEVRDIIATKRPVYCDGRIVGLVGYFTDASVAAPEDAEAANLPTRDPITGVLNYIGLESATWRYVDAYKRQRVDFAMVSINVENLRELNDEFGFEFGDKVLHRVADELCDIAGRSCVIGHVFAERFVVLVQDASEEALQGLCDQVERRLMGIARVDGTPCTVYALASYSLFSQMGDLEAMKRHNLEIRSTRRDKWIGASGDADVVVSSLL